MYQSWKLVLLSIHPTDGGAPARPLSKHWNEEMKEDIKSSSLPFDILANVIFYAA